MDVSELVEEVRRAYDPIVAAHSLQLEVRVERELPAMQADAGRLTQVFENLLENAIKFTPPGGTVAIGAAPLHESVLFSVSDTGVGIREEDMPRRTGQHVLLPDPGRWITGVIFATGHPVS